MRILIVDDELAIRDILQTVCAEEGHETRAAPNVAEALEVWRSWSPECILLDLALPGAPGTQLVRYIRLVGDLTPVIVISGDLRPDSVGLLQHFRVTAIIAKPFHVDQIIEILGTLRPAG